MILAAQPVFSEPAPAPGKDVVTPMLTTLNKLPPRPNFDSEVLIPLRAQQQKAAEDAARAAQAAEVAREAQVAAQAVTQPQPVQRVVYSPPGDDYKAFIYARESGNNPGAVNASSGACGLGQALPCSKMPCSLSDYACQDSFFTSYMLGRYGSWAAAYSFWTAHSYW